MEIFKEIENYNGKYLISSYGYVINVISNKIVKTNKDKEGYVNIRLCINGKNKTYRLHRLIANAFIENKNNYPEVNHKDENKENNNVDNLEWCTRKYNANYGNVKRKISESNTHFILIQKDLEGHYIKCWNSLYDLKLEGYDYNKIRDQIRKHLKPKDFIWEKEYKY